MEDLLSDPIEMYLREVSRIHPLSREDEMECIRQLPSASAQRRLIEANLHLVVSVAQRYNDTEVTMLDLIEKGNEGLMHALNTLSGDCPQGFSAYATPHVERAIASAAANPPPVQLPAHRRPQGA
jgi:RNA polymerase primary sigma factor